ncbi:MAG: hypothetical protein KAR20_14900 [Candidatus Heimdallarchaeota archaeon]|nr:hypothetical protein [Candidatus Heimdallarchaeota archaeon]
MRKIIFSIFIGLFFVVPTSAFAARVYLDPVQKDVPLGDTFLVHVRLDNEGDCSNVADIKMSYDNTILEAVDYSVGESLVSLWVDVPTIDQENGTVEFSGGIPGGYCGRIIGDPGLSNLLATIVFSTTGNRINAVPGNTVSIEILERSKVLLSDGLGTKAPLTVEGAVVTISDRNTYITNEWIDVIKQDTIQPEPFYISVHQNSAVAKGKYFITFNTSDKQSGIDHFEVFESSLENPGYEVGTNKPAHWRIVNKDEQFYVLLDQTLKSKVIVKAVDKANNEQLSELGDRKDSQYSGKILEISFSGIMCLGVIIVILGVIMYVRKRKSTKPQQEEDEKFYENE